jgi:hypothetical protein
VDIDLVLEIEERLIRRVVYVENHRVRAPDFYFRYAALDGTKPRPESNFPGDCFRPGAD